MITTSEAKKMLLTKSKVFYKGIEYKKIKALIYKNMYGSFETIAEIEDKDSNSVITVRLKDLEREENEEALEKIDKSDKLFNALNSEIRTKFFRCILDLNRFSYKEAQDSLKTFLKVANELNEYLERKKAL